MSIPERKCPAGAARRRGGPIHDWSTILGVLTVLAASAFAHAQECSGGHDGGTDATGVQCNSPFPGLVPRSGADTSPAIVLRNRGLAQYEQGDYNGALTLFRRAAEQGDTRSAEMIVLMHRYNRLLYGGRVAIDAVEAKRWAGVVARSPQSALAATGSASP